MCLRTDLASLFWPETSEQAGLQNLRQAVYQWSQVFSASSHSEKKDEGDICDPFLQITRSTIQFFPNRCIFVDILEFAKAIQMENLERAIELYQGEFLAGFAVRDSLALEEWLFRSRAKYHQMVMKALQTQTDRQLANGEYPAAQRSIGRQLVLEPWNEPAHRQKMNLLVQIGQKEAAMAQFELCRQSLQKRFEAYPTQETLDLYNKIRRGQFLAPVSRPEPNRVCPPRLLNFPRQGTAFFGRETEQLRVQEWLGNPQNRIITIVGEGGSGKTRLAIQIAERLANRFEHGAAFVSLVRVGMEIQVAGAVVERPDRQDEILALMATALQFNFQNATNLKSQLLSYLAAKKMLLVLDNFEHLRSDAHVLLDIFQQAPGVVMLVTSRQRLNFQMEHLLHLEGLPVPTIRFSKVSKPRRIFSKEDQLSLAAGSVQLFVERARRVSETFTLTPANLPVVVEICRFLNGNPLGIELAAAQVEMFDCETIADRICGQIDFLQTQMGDFPTRHQSL